MFFLFLSDITVVHQLGRWLLSKENFFDEVYMRNHHQPWYLGDFRGLVLLNRHQRGLFLHCAFFSNFAAFIPICDIFSNFAAIFPILVAFFPICRDFFQFLFQNWKKSRKSKAERDLSGTILIGRGRKNSKIRPNLGTPPLKCSKIRPNLGTPP